ncbi:MAG: hypothetical protein ACFNLO_08645, partial [Selenomonas massiliensis]
AEDEAVTRKQKAVLAFLRSLYEHPEMLEKEQFKVFSPLLHGNVTGGNLKQLLEYLCKIDSERLEVVLLHMNEFLGALHDGRKHGVDGAQDDRREEHDAEAEDEGAEEHGIQVT